MDKQNAVPKYLQKLIEQREGLHLDFKFEISDSRKIARTLSAFANTEGGKLLIGVKDNGKVAGVRSDEELYMIQAAARMYCRPQVDFYFRPWNFDKKTVLEVTIPKSLNAPHLAQDEKGQWRAYIRVNDKNFVVSRVQLRVWKQQKNLHRKPINIRFDRKEDWLLRYLRQHSYITFRRFYTLAHISPQVAEDVLVDLVLLKILEIDYDERGVARYSLKNPNADII